jgi:iron complex outermembrane receptor protein/hemoglobin/transferrin/lactoferrin receptor protein
VKVNSARAWIEGAELQGRWAVAPGWTLRTNLAWTYGNNVTAAEPMRRIPPLMGLAGIAWQREETTAELFVRAATDQRRLSADDIDDSRIDPGGTPGWSDWNLRGSRRFGSVRLSVTLGNIFDHAYKEHGSGVYNPGRHVVVAVNWSPIRTDR